MRKKLTKSMKNDITNKWAKEFSQMGVYKNMWLANIIGPFVVGIVLEVKSGNDRYYPTVHLENLASDIDDELGLIAPIRIDFEEISSISPKDKYLLIANKLRKKAVIPLEGNVKKEVIINRIKEYCKKNYYEVDLFNMLEALMYLVGWIGEEKLKEEISNFVKQRALYMLENDFFEDEQECLEWYDSLLSKTSDRNLLINKVEENISKLKLKHLPKRKIIGI